jgi:serine phosphatase RsbU (regulator of sigma subunit)
VGGDYYGFIPLHEAHETRGEPVLRWAIAVGDVVGKGLPAALLTAQLSAEIRLFLQGETDPARVVTRLNHQLCENGVLDMYITFLLAMLDISNHRLRVVNAGHPCPLIRRHDGRIEEFGKEQSGLPLAIQDDWVYETSETSLEPGDVALSGLLSGRWHRFVAPDPGSFSLDIQGSALAGQAVILRPPARRVPVDREAGSSTWARWRCPGR